MNEGILKLRQILTQATTPKHTDKRTFWDRSQNELGVQLPKAWCTVAENYGSGTIRTALNARSYTWIYNPLSPRFTQQVAKVCDAQNKLVKAHGGPLAIYPLYPEANGYFPLGEDDSENTFWFQMIDNADRWPIVVWEVALDNVLRFDMPLDAFLASLLSGDLGVETYTSQSSLVFVADRPT